MKNCPCGTGKNYGNCCGIYIDQDTKPETPEKLMRSRYTAFTQANIDYIVRTMKEPALGRLDAESAKEWAAKVEWLGLDIMHSSVDNTKGYVEFIAYYIENGKKECIHELSEFREVNAQWYYVDGKHTKARADTKVKVGRNDPCPCGSKAKYKSCCLVAKP